MGTRRSRHNRGRPVKRRPLKITIALDDGLASWLRALVKSPVGIFGNERETIIYLVRSGMIELTANDVYKQAMLPYLPPDMQKTVRGEA